MVYLYYNKVEISGVNTSPLKVLRESEKMELFALADKLGGNLELAIKRLAESKRNPDKATT